MTKKTRTYDEVISRILIELNDEHAQYQQLYQKYNGNTDVHAKHIHQRMVELCERIRREIMLTERK